MPSEPDKSEVKKTSKLAVVLAAVFVVVAVFTLLGGQIPYPHGRAYYRNGCRANLKQIDGAKATWALEHHITNENALVPVTALYGATNYIHEELKCPGGGVYTIGLNGESPRCSLPGHTW
jgi:hypothetical protein